MCVHTYNVSRVPSISGDFLTTDVILEKLRNIY